MNEISQWRRERDSNPRGRKPHPISNRRRYDHFGTSPQEPRLYLRR